MTACLLRAGTPTLLACGLGMSRAPCIAAHAIARLRGEPSIRAFIQLSQAGLADVSHGLWSEAVEVLGGR